MANKDDYLTYYREFFENFAQSVDPNDQLPVKLASYKLVNIEVVGGIIDWATQYLTQKFYDLRMNLGDWRPQENIIKNIEETLQLALVPNSDAQKTVQDRLILMQNLTDFPNYLLFILGSPGFSEDIRSLSGILLKNNIQTTYSNLSVENTLKIKNECLRLLKDPSREVRISISNIIVIIAKDNLKTWPELVPFLTKSFVAQDEYSEVALTTLFKVCEELINSQKPQEEIYKISKEVFPKFVEFVGIEKCSVRQNIVRLINQFLQDYFLVMKQSIDLGIYLRNVMQLANTDDVELQKNVCHTFVIYIDNHEETLLPHLHNIICYLLEKCHHEDQDVALQACEFWLASTKINTCKDILSPYIERLLPTLLKNMRYSDSELNMIKDSLGSDANKKDLSKDISPFHFRDRNNVADGEECYSDEETEEQADDFDDFYVGWTLRKCSAASLDSIAVKFGDEILPLLIPLISEMLQNPDHLVKESAILALGAIAEGCFNGLKPELPELIQFLISCMNDEHSVVRVITCWTLSRYVSWIVNVNPDNPDEYFVPVMTILLKHFIDENKRVQRAAISAFCIFQEEAQLKLIPYIDFILEGFKYGFEQFHCRSLYLLYDAIGVLAQSVGNHLSRDEYVNKLLPPLMKKFSELKNFYDDHFIAVLECLSNVIPALEVSFLPYSEVVYWHCLQLINDTLIASVNYQQSPHEYDAPDKEPMNVAHDVLYSMALGLKTHFVKYVTNSNLIYLLYTTMQDSSNLIRQTSIALYGELIGLCYAFLAPSVNEYIPLIIKNLDEHTDGVCNNAAWVIGKLCSVMGNSIQQFLPEILNAFVHILRTPAVARTMHKTVAISLCIVFFVCPDVTVPDMDVIVKNCCMLVRNVRDSDEKDLAFRGLCEVIVRHPEFNKHFFIFFCDAAASWINIRVDLKEMVRNVLLSFKQQCGEENWRQFYSQFPEALRVKLQELYGFYFDLFNYLLFLHSEEKCPPNLVAPLIKIVIEEIRKACKKQPMSCGFNPADNAYEPLKLMQQVVAKTNEVCLRYLDNSMLCSLPAPGTPYGVTSAYAVKNSRRRMEDRHVVIHDLNTMFNIQDSSPSSYYAIFDGHGGHDAAAYSAAHLHQYLAENKHFVTNPKQALLDAFCKTDALFVDKCKVENLVSGTTALVALLCPKAEKLYVAWAGDSLGMLVSRGNIIKLVNPHKPIRTDEKIRVEDQGGCVMMRAGTWRVNGHLAVSRAIGDADYKPFITAVPEIREINLNGGEDFLILASDGLWDCVFEESATWLVYNLICENPDDTDRISKYLIVSAREKGSLDNISVIVVFLREPSKIAAEARRGNPFTMDAISNGASTDNILSQKTESPLSDLIKQNGTNLSSKLLGEKESNGGQHVSEYFDDDDDFGPETDVDAVDDAVSPIEQIKAFGDSKDINNPFDEGVYNPFLEHQEKAALEMERNLQKQEESGEFEETRMAREETPTPPADAVHDVRGLVENTAESDSEDEWNYIKGDEANKENTSPEPETQVAEIPEEDDTMSGLNPNAAEFVPISPTRSIPSPACRTLINDQVISQSPKRPVQELDINLPNPSDFENEVKSRPSEVDSYSNGHNGDSDRTASSTDMEDILNGKNIDDIPEFQPGSTPKKVLPTDEFHFGPNAAPFTPVKLLDQSEAALSTKAIYGDESAATLDTSFNESIVTAEDTATDLNILNKESDPMSMSFYADKGETNPFDLNEVQVLPENLDDFLKQPESEQLNDTISDLPEHHPLEDLAKPRVFSLNNDDAIQVTDLDKKSYDDEKELASPLEPEKDVDISEKDSQEGAEEIDFSKTPEPTHENLFAGEFCDVSEKSSELGVGVLPPDVELISPEPRTESPQEVLSESKSPLPENVPRDVELLSPSPKPEIDGYLQNENPLEPKEATEVGDLLGQPEAAEVGDLLGQPEATEVGDLLGQPEATEVGDLLLEPEATEVIDLLEQPIAVEEIEPEDPPKQPEATEVSDLLKTSDATEALERLEAIEDNDSLKQPEETKVENLLDQPEAAEVGDLLKQDVVEVSHSLEKLQKPTDVGDLLGKPEDIEGIDLLQAETELSENKSPVCDASESKSSICDLPELKSPYSDEVVCGLPRDTEELESPESPVYTEPQLIEKAQVHFEQLCHPTEDIKVLESPREDDVTSSVKDDDDDDNSSQVKSPVHENVIEDSFVADESTICVGQETNGILSSPCEEPEVVSPKSIAETESVATTDVNSFLDRSLPPDVTSPLSPTEEQLEEMRKCVYSSGDQPTEELETVHPALSKCVYPLSTQSTGEEIDVKTENISPEFAEQTIVTPSEESKQGEALSVPPSEQPLVESVLEEKQESKELEKEMTAVGIASAVATGAAIAAVVSATKVEDKKKTTSKNPTASKSATTTSKAALKVSPATKTSSRPSSSPRVPLTKTGTTKPATTTAAAPKPATAKPPTKPRTTGPPKSADKKPLANGDVKSTVKSTLTSRRVTSETAATKTSTNPRPVTATSKSSPTKTAPSRPTLKPTTAAKPASATSRPATTTTSSTRTRPTTLTSKPLGSVSPSKTSSSTTRTTLTKVSPRTATAPPKPKSAPTSALTAKPKTPLANKTVGKAPVTEKQIKESANKLTASRSVTSTTRITAAKSTSSSVRRVESKTTSSATRTIQSKTTTTTMKSTTGKKPAEIIRNGPTKTKTTKIEKPKENGVSSTVVTEEITVVSNNTTIDSDPQLFKDNSPVDNKLIENTLIQTNAAD